MEQPSKKQTQFKPKTNPFLPPKITPKAKTNPIKPNFKRPTPPQFPAGYVEKTRLRNYEIPKGKKYENEVEKQKRTKPNPAATKRQRSRVKLFPPSLVAGQNLPAIASAKADSKRTKNLAYSQIAAIIIEFIDYGTKIGDFLCVINAVVAMPLKNAPLKKE